MNHRRKPNWLKKYDRERKWEREKELAKQEKQLNLDRQARLQLRVKVNACEVCGATACFLLSHHITPLGKGGPDEVSNIVRMCQPCEDMAHGRRPAPDTTVFKLLCYAVDHGVIGGNPRNTILAAVAADRAEQARRLVEKR